MTSPTKRRTFSREQWEAAQAAWTAGGFGDEWREWRHLAAMTAGIVAPPTGDRWDSWGDDVPSERALIVRAIRETPEALRAAIGAPGVRSWSSVIAILIRGRDGTMDDVERRERAWLAEKAPRRGAMTPLSETLGAVTDSLGVER